MAGGNLSLKVLLELQKKGWDKGVASVRSSLQSLQRTITGISSAFIGGLGLSRAVSDFKETAKELSQVKATLENVSDSVTEYEQSLTFLARIANEYGQDQIALTEAFAKFRSAAKASSLPLDEVRNIFEAMTRAAGAFHLSADQTSNAMMALEQMMSKGKVTAEELRRQLGNTLPGAFNIMAKAAGEAGITANGTAAELEEAMKKGQVVAEEVLPFFAKELNKVTKSANFDSLISSINRMNNAWADFVNNSEFTPFYKSIIDGSTNMLKAAGRNFNELKRLIIAVFSGVGAGYIVNWGKKLLEVGDKANPLKTRLGELKSQIKKTNDEVVILDKQIASVQKRISEQGAGKRNINVVNANEMDKYGAQWAKDRARVQIEGAKKYNAEVRLIESNEEELVRLQNKRNDLSQRGVALMNEAGKLSGGMHRPLTLAQRAWAGLKTVAQGVLTTIKAIGVQMLAAFAVTILTNFIMKLVEARKEAQRIANIPKESEKNWQTLSEETAKQTGNIQTQFEILKSARKDSTDYINALNKINELLGLSGDEALTVASSLEDVEKAVNKGKNAIVEENKELQRLGELEHVSGKIEELQSKIRSIEKDTAYNERENIYDQYGHSISVLTKKAIKLRNEVFNLNKELKQWEQARTNLLANAPQTSGAQSDAGGGPSLTKDEQEVKKALDAYKSKVDDLNKAKKNGTVTGKKYNQELKKAAEKAGQTIGTYEDLDEIVAKLGGDYATLVAQIKKANAGGGGGSGTKDPVVEAMNTMRDEVNKLDNQFKNGVITVDEYNESLKQIVTNCQKVVGAEADMESALKRTFDKNGEFYNSMVLLKTAVEAYESIEKDAQEKLEDAVEKGDELLDKMIDQQNAFNEIGLTPERPMGKRDDTFDYKKTGSDKLGEDADRLEDYRDKIEAYIKAIERIKAQYGYLDSTQQDVLNDAIALFQQASKEAKNARMKAQLAEITEDLKEYKKELGDARFDVAGNIVSGLQGISSSIEGCIDSWQRLSDSSSNFFDVLNAGFNTLQVLLTTMETIRSTIQAVQTAEEAYKKFKEASDTKEVLMSRLKVLATQDEAKAKVEGAAQSIVATTAEATASKAAAGAEGMKAAAGAASSVANIPYIGPILAVAAIATVVGALLAAFAKFKDGGIVGGTKTQGDQNVIRANSGEMVLNKAQQGNLFNMINNGGAGGNVQFRIKGTDLIGVMDNTAKAKRG